MGSPLVVPSAVAGSLENNESNVRTSNVGGLVSGSSYSGGGSPDSSDVPQTMLPKSPHVPQTMLSASSCVPQTMLSRSRPQVVPQTMFSPVSRNAAPHVTLVAHAVPAGLITPPVSR